MNILDDLRAAAERRRRATLDHATARMQRWQMKHGAKLAGMHPDVALEVRSVVMARFLAGTEGGMTDKDLHECRMRVASRLRIKRYGPCDGDEETARQLKECVAAISGGAMEKAA